jgi:preprotein translocase subunit Sec63
VRAGVERPHRDRASIDRTSVPYDPDQVAHLGAELREHFKAKAQAVEQAYHQLTK